ncbi:transposable element Tcb2 transposase [Trichonephila clavipes]|uniref:Transposable element Tcb2 transposase n=1 Tax=Trichonephila clavipes TaxID=2585209 RepID=A0A8X6VJY1_TRICX|nr:transposable element Tcb2 transposase [Trichonephila clavipes]
MVGYPDLSEFERGVIVGTREVKYSISEVEIKFGFLRTTISRVNCEYRKSAEDPPLLTVRHKALRLSWARQHRHWTVDDWKHVAWSDESRFQLNRADGRVRVWRQPHESMDATCQQGTVQAGGGSFMVQGMCSCCDMGALIRLNTSLTGT